MVTKVACCGGQLVHSNHPHTALGEGWEAAGGQYPDRLQTALGAGYEVRGANVPLWAGLNLAGL
jgi:hypothetical protein